MMESLNPQQLRAVRHRDGPLLILAGAGTGKTRVITERLARLLREGVQARNLLAVTFTNKAAAEMRDRLIGLADRSFRPRDVILSTFHSLAVRLLRADASRVGFTSGFLICDQGEQMAAVRKAMSTIRSGTQPAADKVLARIGALKNRGISPGAFARSAADDEEMILAAVYRRYQETLQRQNFLDFDDLLLQAMRLLRENPDVLDRWRDRFRYLMIDEFQDANQAQFDLMRLLASPRDNLCVVGDDDQSIYAWRGAAAGNILRFRESYPEAVEVTLEQNYRSTSTILSAANAVIRINPGRREKNLWSDLGRGRPLRLLAANDQFEEAEWIARKIRDRMSEEGRKARFSDFAVIIRANAQSRPLEDAFLAARTPFEVIGGQSLFDRKEARDVLAFLALALNPLADGPLRRILGVPPRGIGEKTQDALAAGAVSEGTHLFQLLAWPERAPGVGGAEAAACRRFAAEIRSWGERLRRDGVNGLGKAILEETGYQEEIRNLYRDPLEAASRWNEALETGESLAAFAARIPGARPEETLAPFLDEAARAGPPARGEGRARD
ncbi:MAG: UvrD-helicase domain-containing protein, partial [Planctomycetota bacterium]|nr:UvrD-helicase domain-containing protein [Planctomycetota bacterium]